MRNSMIVTAKGLWQLPVWQGCPFGNVLPNGNINVKFDTAKASERIAGNIPLLSEAAGCRLEAMLKNADQSILKYPLVALPSKKDALLLPDSLISPTSSDLVFCVSAMLPDAKVKCQWQSDDGHYGIYEMRRGTVTNNKEYVKDLYGIDRETEVSKNDRRFSEKYHRLYDVPVSWISGRTGSEKYAVSVPYPNGKQGFGKIFVPAEDIDFNPNGKTAKIFLRGQTTDVYYRPEKENVTSIDRMYNGDLVHLKNEMTKRYRMERLMSNSMVVALDDDRYGFGL